MTAVIAGSSLLIVIVALLRVLLRGKVSARLIYSLWALVLLRLLLPFSIELGAPSAESAVRTVYERTEFASIAFPAEATPAVQAAPAAPATEFSGAHQAEPTADAAETLTEESLPETETGPETGRSSRPVAEYLKLAWLCGSAAMLLLFAALNLGFYLRLRSSRRPAGRSGAGLRAYECDAVASPCIFGLVRPAIYFSASDRGHLEHILLHEDCHYRQLDHVWALLRSVCLAVYWWDPLVWLAAALSRTDCELACDEAALSRLGEGERSAYGETLISLASKPGPAELLRVGSPLGSGKRELKARILAIARGRKRLVVPAVLAVALCIFCAACAFSGGETEEPGPSGPDATDEPEGFGEFTAEPAEGVPNIFVSPTEAGGELCFWAPEDQTELAALFEAAMDGADAGASIEPGVQRLGLGVLDAEGYYWAFLTDGGMATTTGAWYIIPAEAAAALREYVDSSLAAMGLGAAAEPGEISGLVSATLRNFFGGDYTITDEDALGQIEALLAASEPACPGSCGFDMYLELELENGEALTLGMAQDGCPAWQSEGRYYMYPAESDSALCSWFALEPISRLTASELLDSPLLSYLDWSKYYSAMGTLSLMHELGEAAQADEAAAAKFLGARLGLDGAYAEAYTEELYGLYLAAPEQLARAWEDLTASERADTALQLAFRTDRDADSVEAELRQLAAEGRRLYTAEGFGEDAFALLMTEEQPDGTLDFTLRFSEGWGETGDPYAAGSLSAVTVSGTAQADGSFTARAWSRELNGRLSLTDGGASFEYLGFSGSEYDFTDPKRPYIPSDGPGGLVYNIYLPVDFRERRLSEYEELLRGLPYFSGEEELPIPTYARPCEIFEALGLPDERQNSGLYWSMTFPQTVVSGLGTEPYLVSFYQSSDPELAPQLRGIEPGCTAQEVISRFPNRYGSFEALLEAAGGEGGAVFYGCGLFYGSFGRMSLSEGGGTILLFDSGVSIVFNLDGGLRVVSIERREMT